MSDVQLFQFPTTGQQIRTVVRGGEPWFVAPDVCVVLELTNPRSSLALLDADERGVHTVDTLGGPQSVNLVNEPGLYSLILRSRKSEAKAFKRWVTHDVLPALRRTGRYEVAEVSRKELARMVIEAEEARELAQERADEAEHRLAIAGPKADAYTAFMDADGTYSVEQVAKMLYAETGLGRNRLFKRLRELNVLQHNNLPYQRYAHHFHVVANSFEHSDGRREVTYTTRVRATGVEFIRGKLGCTQGQLVPVGAL